MKKLKIWLRRLAFLLPGLIALLLYLILPRFPQIAETLFARGLFRVITTALGGLISLLPFSLTEVLAVPAIPAALVLLIVFIIKRIKREKTPAQERIPKRRSGAPCVLVWILSCAALMYMLCHGVNYCRLPAEQLLGYDSSVCTPDELLEICVDLARRMSSEREGLNEDENGCMTLSESTLKTLRQAADGYRALQKEHDFLWGGVWRAKPVLLSRWWSYTGVAGMYFPLLAEANVNTDQPDCRIPSAAAHELAHTRGFAREDECNFFAYLSCISNESRDFRYSGYLLAYTCCANALYAYDGDLWLEARSHCSEAVLRDMRATSEYWKQFEGKIEEASNAVNDTFLQAQGIEDGVLSYGRAVKLIVGHYRSAGSAYQQADRQAFPGG